MSPLCEKLPFSRTWLSTVWATWGRTLSALVILATVAGCTPGREPFLSARVCLSEKRDVSIFLTLLEQTAKVQHMEFFDRTSSTRDELKTINDPNAYVRDDGFMLNAGILRKDGMGVTAGELGGPGYQIGLGFSTGANPAEAQIFANSMIAKLRERWEVDTVPKGIGLQPMAVCE